MRYHLRFLPDVEEDVMSAYAWYEEKSRGLGDEFVRVFYACVEEIGRNPQVSAIVYKHIRRRLVRRFPYAVYFATRGNEAVVYGVFHCARAPRSIHTTIVDRDEIWS